MGTEFAEAIVDIAMTLLPYEISKKDRDKIAEDLKTLVTSYEGLEDAFLGVRKGE